MWFDGMGSCMAEPYIQQAIENIQIAICYTKKDDFSQDEVNRLETILKMLNKEV